MFIFMAEGLVETLKALADPLRLRILAVLGQEELAVGELAEALAISQPRVSHHLRMLREAGLVRVRREGAWTFCSLETSSQGGPAEGLLQAVEQASGPQGPDEADRGRLERVLSARRERARSFFDAAAGRWEHFEPRFEGSGLRQQGLSMLLDDGLVLADIGCGTGFVARELVRRATKVILVDPSAAMLEKARTELDRNLPARVEFRVGELERLPLAAGEVDGAFANLVLHHVSDLAATLKELARVIRPGGTLVISDLLPHEEDWLREEQADLRLGLEPTKLAKLALRAGFAEAGAEPGADRLRVRSKDGREALLPMFVMRARKGTVCPTECKPRTC
jgi:ubiquinone/menaquinone biosynthesis C-methylase UbiE/DNA-binding transcriptional ArsR family regulator